MLSSARYLPVVSAGHDGLFVGVTAQPQTCVAMSARILCCSQIGCLMHREIIACLLPALIPDSA